LRCFSNGVERDYHQNFHDYKIIDLNKIQSFDGWTINQELELIDTIENSTFDIQLSNLSSIENNWTKIFKSLNINNSSKTTLNEFYSHVDRWLNLLSNKDDCQDNCEPSNSIEKLINDYFLIKGSLKTASKKTDLSKDLESGSCKLMPMRPLEHTTQFRRMNGYRPARGDFETELNDNFEIRFISNLDYNQEKIEETQYESSGVDMSSDEESQQTKFEDEDIESDLKLSIVDSYVDLVSDRYQRKKFIREFGLLNEIHSNQTVLFNDKISYLSLQQSMNCTTLRRLTEKDLLNRMTVPIKFQRLFNNFEEYSKYNELVNYQVHLAKKIEELQDYRRMGIKSLKHTSIYKKLKTKRINHTPSVFMSNLFTSLNRCSSDEFTSKKSQNTEQFKEWFKQLVMSEKSVNEKKTVFNYQTVCKNNPLKIENYPDYEKLNEDEKEFCRVARVQPVVFLRVKSILLLECNKVGHCSYSRARKIAGIDVNKTRLIHNLLVNNNIIKASA